MIAKTVENLKAGMLSQPKRGCVYLLYTELFGFAKFVGKDPNHMKLTYRLTAAALALTIGAGVLATPIAASASEEGRRNTMLGLGAAAAALLLTQKNKVPGIIAGAGAVYAYKRYQDSVNDRHDRYRYYGDYSDRSRRDDWRDRRDDRYDRRDDWRDRRDDRDSRDRNDRRDDNRDRNHDRDNDRWDYRR